MCPHRLQSPGSRHLLLPGVDVRERSHVHLPANRLSGLFDSGAAGSTPGTDGERGTGLGLMLCKELVEANGGTLSVASTLGQGSTFRVTLPSAAGCPAPRN